MLELPDLNQLADAGGWAAFAALSIAILGVFILGKVHSQGELDREIERRKHAEERADKAGKQVDDLTAAVREGNAATARMAQSLEWIEDVVRDLLRERLGSNDQRPAARPRTRSPRG